MTTSPTDLKEHDCQAVGSEARPLITVVAGTDGRAVESTAGDLLLEYLREAGSGLNPASA